MGIISWIIIGALAGFVAGRLMKGGGFGFVVNLVVGIIGGLLGGWIFETLGVSIGNGFVGSLVTSVIGSIVFLYVLSLFSSKK